MELNKQRMNRQWRLAKRPEGIIKHSDFEWHEEPVPALQSGQALIRNVYLSLDPTIRLWASDKETYLLPVAIGEVMRGISIGVVEASKSSKLKAGSFVQGLFGWQDYAVTDGRGVYVLPTLPAIPLTRYFGLLGHIGLTAYLGLSEIGKPVPGETMVVSAAAGAVGSIAGQIGKIKRCRVIGIAGSKEKCRWIKEELGFDEAINYKEESVAESLRRYCPNGVDIYFDNVGGDISNAVLNVINYRARIIVCGLISQYTAAVGAVKNINVMNVLIQRARMEGFIVMDYVPQPGFSVSSKIRQLKGYWAMANLMKWHAQGRLKYRIDVVEGLENAVTAVNKLFDGSNSGKLIVQISKERQ